ncbi:hypothetical protein MSAN_02002900 [Mycena sanguinolenta]|uniref:Uncharacterized protein n=1 Tax=Mycena sanguinolenta TaxID=230812 RepID=A0A8H7CNU7_9AGAR|nr:hypothetical protein MSAN_02002900 [Mycena sanguinolenta]
MHGRRNDKWRRNEPKMILAPIPPHSPRCAVRRLLPLRLGLASCIDAALDRSASPRLASPVGSRKVLTREVDVGFWLLRAASAGTPSSRHSQVKLMLKSQAYHTPQSPQ